MLKSRKGEFYKHVQVSIIPQNMLAFLNFLLQSFAKSDSFSSSNKVMVDILK